MLVGPTNLRLNLGLSSLKTKASSQHLQQDIAHTHPQYLIYLKPRSCVFTWRICILAGPRVGPWAAKNLLSKVVTREPKKWLTTHQPPALLVEQVLLFCPLQKQLRFLPMCTISWLLVRETWLQARAGTGKNRGPVRHFNMGPYIPRK
jgi:hypothetical protein